MQSNNPKHFLSEEEFVQLRLELSKASLAAMVGEDEETPVPQEELPPGTEDLSDPAKVNPISSPAGETNFHKYCLQGLAGACLFSMMRWKESFVQVWRGVFMSAANQWMPGGIQVGIQSGTRPKTLRINRGPLTPEPAPRGWYAGCRQTSPLYRLLVSGKLMVM